MLKVSLPIELVNFRVSVPLTSFLNAPVPTIIGLNKRLQSFNKIPQGMQEVIVTFSLSYFNSTLVLVIFGKHGFSVVFILVISLKVCSFANTFMQICLLMGIKCLAVLGVAH